MKTSNQSIAAALILLGIANLIEQPQALGQVPSNASAAAARASFEPVLREFVRLAALDTNLGGMLLRHGLTIECNITDLNLRLHVGSDGTKLVCGFGPAGHQAELVFTATAKALDRALRSGACGAGLSTKVNLSLGRKFGLRKDRDQLMAWLTRDYLKACECAGAVTLARNESH